MNTQFSLLLLILISLLALQKTQALDSSDRFVTSQGQEMSKEKYNERYDFRQDQKYDSRYDFKTDERGYDYRQDNRYDSRQNTQDNRYDSRYDNRYDSRDSRYDSRQDSRYDNRYERKPERDYYDSGKQDRSYNDQSRQENQYNEKPPQRNLDEEYPQDFFGCKEKCTDLKGKTKYDYQLCQHKCLDEDCYFQNFGTVTKFEHLEQQRWNLRETEDQLAEVLSNYIRDYLNCVNVKRSQWRMARREL